MRTVLRSKPNRASLMMLTLVTFGLMLAVGVAAASDPKFTTIDVPGATLTFATDINSEGDIVGVYSDATKKLHGFLLSDGNLTTIDFPGATQTRAFGINPRGNIVGDYKDTGGGNHGFQLRDGVFASIEFPGATFTDAWGISPKRDIAGTYVDANGKQHAYLLNKHGEFVTLDPPFSFAQAQIHGVNSNGDAVGCVFPFPDGTKMRSLLVRDGEYITNDFPDSMMSMNWKINARGWMVGHYADAGGKTHGYLAKGSRYTTVDFPGAVFTEARGINDSKDIVGRYKDAANKIHGFLLSGN